MLRILLATARRFWPELDKMSEQRRLAGIGDVVVFLASAPLAVAGLLWLVSVTDLDLARQNWAVLILMGALVVLFNKVSYFIIVEIRSERYGSADGSFANMVQWSAALLFGPTALWISVLWSWVTFFRNQGRFLSSAKRWGPLRNFALDQAANTLGFLTGLHFYQRWGGATPIANLSIDAILPAVGALIVHFAVLVLTLSPYIAYVIWVQSYLERPSSVYSILKFLLLAMGLPFLAYPFGILASGLYIQNGMAVFLFFMSGLFLVAYLARRLSWAVESSRQQSRQLQKLEHFGRDLINAPPDASRLPDLLDAHIPTMFPPGRVAIWLAPDRVLFKNPQDWPLELSEIWQWVARESRAQAFLSQDELPWNSPENNPGDHDPLVVAPILDVETSQPIGCIYLELRSLVQPWDSQALTALFPGMHSLADQVASALHQARVYEETLEYQQALQELHFAGRIQASFLPNEIPHSDGWELAVTLMPARETSGDFFDFIPFEDGKKIGILIADVADKGVGAALYMALSRTLIRTYALEYTSQPDIVILEANERILQDARANLFITAFYAVLDQENGLLTYCNAGHNPPYLFQARNGGTVQPLPPTGMPVGIDEDAVWGQASVQIEPGDTLILYTDGIPDAQNTQREFFGENRLVEAVREGLNQSAQDIQICVLKAVENFAGEAQQFDDITLLVLMRHAEGTQT